LSQLSFASLASCLPLYRVFAGTCISAAAQAAEDSKPVANHHPLPTPGSFDFLQLGSIRPSGWLKNQLRIQANGLSGHLGETWADVGSNSGWLGGTGESWERGPYYLDGLLPLAYLLEDDHLKATAQRFIDWTLEHQAPNGMIGPASNNDWWPRIVMLKALIQYQELTGDTRVIPVMDKYFRYQLAELPTRPLRDWGRFRWQDAVLSVLWLYRRSGEPYLLDLAQLLRKQGYDWIAEFQNFPYTEPVTRELLKLNNGGGLKDLALATHGVNNAQAVKAGAVWSQVSGADADRQASMHMILELEKYHGLPNGMFSCDEHLAGPNPSQGSELCSVVEYMFSLENSLAITGDPSLGDRLERLAFNALPGTFTDDMWAHQYNQEPNQVECSLHHKPWTTDGPESNLYGLEPNFGCCTANFHQGWPKFAAALFMASTSDSVQGTPGLVAAAYAPCEVRTSLGGTAIHVVEETDYPFRGTVRFTVNPAAPVRFPLHLRIPAWAAGTAIQVNGKTMPAPTANSFAQIERVWTRGDKVEMVFLMQPRISRWFNDSIAVERGPLVFSYGIGENWVKLRDRGMTADWQVFPASQWNYTLKIDSGTPAKSVSVAESDVSEGAFTRSHAPVTLGVKARKLDNWRAEDGVANPLPQSPVVANETEEAITLIPYAAAKLRITAFPQCKS
jgi:hypothetical protein